jgi:hypothetical protein
MTINDTHQRCQHCNAGLYQVADWDVEIERPTDQRGWFCGVECRSAWFQDNLGFTPATIESNSSVILTGSGPRRARRMQSLPMRRPTCTRCRVPMIRYGGPGRFRCRHCTARCSTID